MGRAAPQFNVERLANLTTRKETIMAAKKKAKKKAKKAAKKK